MPELPYKPTTTQTARDTAALLVRGYNEHIRAHGPDDSYAAGRSHRDIVVMPDPASYGFIVNRDGREVAVLVITPGPGETALGVINAGRAAGSR